MLPADPSLSIAERVDAACDRFESEWKSGARPRIDAYVAAAPESDRDALRQALHALALELQGRSEAETSVTRSSVRSDARPAPGATVDHVPSEDLSSSSIGRFEILGTLGAGAFGRVYRAFDPQLGREVAVKVPLESAIRTETDRARFLKEARSAATINHPNICQVHEVGEADGQPYIVMALVPGQSLADTLKARKQPLPEKQAALVVRKIALALASAHEKGIVHRDLKPANVMFDRERKDIVVMDFGLARGPQFGDARGTQSGVIMGTPAYMSPEQARGDAKGVGPAGDIFSLGVILYELLTGVRPFSGTATEVIGQILHVAPEPPSQHQPGIDPRLEAACLKAMAKEPTGRFSTMKEFAKAIDAILRVPAPAGPEIETARASATRREGDDRSTNTSSNLADVFAVLSADRKQVRAETAAVVEAAFAKHRTPRWVFALIGLLFVGGLTTLAGIVFFTRSDKVMVTIELTDVDLADKSLSFFLDDEPISAEALANPIELTPGEHVLVVKRGKEIVKRMLLTVSGGRNPGMKVRDITPPPSDGPTPANAPFDAQQASRYQAEWAKHLGVPVEFTNSIGMKFRLIPPGTYRRGLSETDIETLRVLDPKADPKLLRYSQPQHVVRLTKPYWIGVHEVTVGQFREFVNSTRYVTRGELMARTQPDLRTWKSVPWQQTDSHPVVNVTWNETQTFVKWLSRKDGWEYRLPTEAEWEFACRAGTESFWWSGNELEGLAQIANVADAAAAPRWKPKHPNIHFIPVNDGHAEAAPVGSYPANPFGLHDMIGNVWEWCSDRFDDKYYDTFGQKEAVDPAGPATGEFNVRRGGAWLHGAGYATATGRLAVAPDGYSVPYGFRIAIPFDPKQAGKLTAASRKPSD